MRCFGGRGGRLLRVERSGERHVVMRKKSLKKRREQRKNDTSNTK